jgi:hypothetical protein
LTILLAARYCAVETSLACMGMPPSAGADIDTGGEPMAERRYGGITLGWIIVILGIILIIVWSFWIGLIVTLIGLVAFGGFARGKWY